MIKATLLDVLDRTFTGPVCKLRDWDTKIVPIAVQEKLKEYGLQKTCTPENPISSDDGLADDFWKAGFDLALEVGMLCTNTERTIKFTEEELKRALKNAPAQIPIGTGFERVMMQNRKPDDERPAVTVFGAFGTATSEDLFVKAVQAAAQYKSVDGQIQPTLLTMYDTEARAGTPYEVLYGQLEAVLSKEGARRAGRPGIGFDVVAGDTTGLGHLGGYGTPGGFTTEGDWSTVLTPSSLKTNYYLLNKVAHTFNVNGFILSCMYGMIGGYSGPPEGCVVSANAAAILQLLVHQGSIIGASVYDMRILSGSSRDCIWANSVANQAQSRNTHILNTSWINPLGGPCTEMLLYETAAQGIGGAVSGAGWVAGLRPRGGKYPNYFSGLESGFAGEVCKASAGIKRTEANEIVKAMIQKYEEKLPPSGTPPIGKEFSECTDLKTLKPSKEWQTIYHKVKNELVELGLPI